MSSSTESISKGEEKEANSENNPKDEMPKVTSTKETNSKGARPKTTGSSTSDKSKKETVEKKQFLKVLIMNASGPNQGKKTAATKKQTIIDVIKGHEPDLVLFQEFTWKKIKGTKWPYDKVIDHYTLDGSDDTKIMYNINKFILEESRIGELQRTLKQLQTVSSMKSTPIPLTFAPISRMCLRVVNAIDEPDMKFICISWHGRNKHIKTNDTSKHKGRSEKKKTEFKHLMIFITEIYVKINLPLMIGGDFNVDIESISKEVNHPFTLYKYKASERREEIGVIDYFIASTGLQLSGIEPVDLKTVSHVNKLEDMKDRTVSIVLKQPDLSDKPPVDQKKNSKTDNPEDVLDHDPIIAMLELAPLSAPAPAQDEVTDKLKVLKLD